VPADAATAYLERNTPEFAQEASSAYGDMIGLAALLHDIDEKLILSVIIVESEGRPSATSNRGARGLMQLMPATAKEMGAKDPSDPLQNILAGTKYLKQLDSRYGFDDPKEALVAYNMGPTRAKRWLSEYSAEDFLYVQKVMHVYEYLSGLEEEARIAEAERGISVDGLRPAMPILTKPRIGSLSELPLSVPSGRRLSLETR
jgi:soluble lytic murein transglycosylase-like protein